MSDALDEIFEQTKIRVDKRTRHGNLGWAIPPNIERASVSRESTAIANPRDAAARLDPDEKDTDNVRTPGGPQETTIISEPVTSYKLIAGRPGEGIATHYVHLIPLLRDRLAYFAIRYEDFDTHCDFPDGLTGKCLGPAMVKRFGIDKFFDALVGAGLRLRVEEDPEQTAKMRQRIAENYVPRQANQARPGNHSRLSNRLIDDVLSYLANKKGGLTVLNAAVKEARSNWARHAAKALWEKKRGRGTGDFAAYLGNISRISNTPALRPAEVSTSDANAA